MIIIIDLLGDEETVVVETQLDEGLRKQEMRREIIDRSPEPELQIVPVTER